MKSYLAWTNTQQASSSGWYRSEAHCRWYIREQRQGTVYIAKLMQVTGVTFHIWTQKRLKLRNNC